jgi:uncharacterized protein
MFYRKATENLKEWAKRNDRKPLIIRGARQVGKTTLVNGFAKDFDQYIYLNLEEPQDADIFESNEVFDKLLTAIFFYKNSRREGRRTLIFIDEIQYSAKSVKQLRYFYEKSPDLYVIAAGSLLETVFDADIHFPVGRVEYLYLQPFSFDEFLRAVDETSAADILSQIPFPDYAFNKLRDLFHLYVLTGGMPEIVKKYAQTRDILQLSRLYEALIVSYLDDVEKYADSEKEAKILRHIIRNAFLEAGNRIKFNNFAKSNYQSREVAEAIAILEKTHLLSLIYPTTAVELPIVADKKKSPKLQVLDTGFINYFAGIQHDLFSASEIQDVYKGRIAEHITAQQLKTVYDSPLANLHFWVREKKQSSAEVDFIISHKGKLIPVEVKSGTTGRLRSLHQFMDRAEHNLGVRIFGGDFSIQQAKTIAGKSFYLMNLPYFLTLKLKPYLDYFLNFVNKNHNA